MDRLRGRFHPLAVAVALVALLAAVATTGCQVEVGTERAASEAAGKLDRAVLDHQSRTEDDRYRDGGFKPIEVYAFLGIEPDMTVADIWPGGGYHTHILSLLTAGKGRVLSVLGPIYMDSDYEEWSRDKLKERIAAGDLSNVDVVGPLSDVPDDSVDVTVRNYHDLGDRDERTVVLPGLMRALKPGGIIGVVEAYTPKKGVDKPFHRINEDLVINEFTEAGFELVGRSDILLNPDDTYDFDGREEDDPIHRYFIHRFVHKYQKPAA
jgi:predicted methyltransferase